MTDYALVLTYYPDYSGRLWGMTDNDYATLIMHDDGPKPTQAELDAAWPQVQYDRAYAQVEAQRRARYQAETDGMFFATQREGGDLTAWQAAVDAIKADLPYPQGPQ
jgi:hypothetical protein